MTALTSEEWEAAAKLALEAPMPPRQPMFLTRAEFEFAARNGILEQLGPVIAHPDVVARYERGEFS